MDNKIIIDLGDKETADRAYDAFAVQYGWSEDMGLTKQEFTQQRVADFIKQRIKNYETDIQIAAVKQAVSDDVESIPIA